MPLLHGKQIQNSSIILNKLSGTGSLVIQTGAVLQVPTANILTSTDVVNKEYVDNMATGMNPHAAVKTATTGNLSLTTATVSPVISGYTVSTNDRILVWQQSITASNGIYVYNGSTFSRATDMDGQPNTEVSVGDYTFVVSGNYAGNGYVVVSSGTYSGILEPIDVAPIVWSQFTGPGQFTWGNGLMNTSNVIDIDLAGGSGLTFSAGQLTIDSLIAGNGLAWSSGVLNVNTANGLTINGDNVELSQTVAGTGLTFNAGVISVNTTNGLSTIGDNVGLGGTLSQATSINGNGNTLNITNLDGTNNNTITAGNTTLKLREGNTELSDLSTAGYMNLLTNYGSIYLNGANDGQPNIDMSPTGALSTSLQMYAGATGNGVSDGSSNNRFILRDIGSKGIVYHGDYTANFTNNSLVTKQYVDSAVSSSGLTAINGLTETAPNVISLGGTLSQNTTIFGANRNLTIDNLQDLLISGSGSTTRIANTNGNTMELNDGGWISLTTDNNGFGSTAAWLSFKDDSSQLNVKKSTNAYNRLQLGGSLNAVGLAVAGDGSSTSAYMSLQGLAFINGIYASSSATYSIGGVPAWENINTTINANYGTVGQNVFATTIISASGAVATQSYTLYTGNLYSMDKIQGSRLFVDNIEIDTTGAINGQALIYNGTAFVPATASGDIQGVTAGNGLSGGGASGYVTLDVNTSNGLSVVSDNVVLGGTLSQNTTINGGDRTFAITGLSSSATQIFGVDSSDTLLQLYLGAGNGSFVDYTTNGYIQIETNGGGMYLNGPTGNKYNRLFGGLLNTHFTLYGQNTTIADGSTNNSMVIRDSANSKGLVYHGDYTANFTTYSLITKGYVDNLIATSGDITGVTAGAGLTGGGTAGFVTLDVNTNNGISITSDVVGLGGSLVRDTQVSNGANIFTMSSTGGDIFFNTVDGGGTAQIRTLVTDNTTGTSSVRTVIDSNTLRSVDSTGRDAQIVTQTGGTSYMRSVTGAGTASFTANLAGATIDTGATSIIVRNSNTSIGDGSTNNRMVITDTANSKGLVYAGDYTANFTTYSLVTKQYVDAISAGLGDITGVTAGDGLSGGGASGFVTLNVNTGTGITISSDAVTLADTAVTIGSYGSATTVSTFTVDQQGRLTAAGNSLIDIPSGQINNFTSSVTSIITTDFGAPVYTQRNLSPVATTGNGASSSLTITSTPKDIVNVSVYVNGQLQFLGNGTTASVDCYFGTQSASAKTIANITAGDTLFWNGTYVGFDLSTTDKVDIIYNA